MSNQKNVITFPNSAWKLHQTFSPSGDQPIAIKNLLNGIDKNFARQTLLGVTGSGKTFTMANVIAQSGKSALVIAPNKTLAAQLYAEFKEFFPENAVEYFVSYYDYYQPEAYVPSKDLYIEKDSAINENIEQLRLSATKSLLERPKDVLIVASVSCIYGLGDVNAFSQMILLIKIGDKISQKSIMQKLTQMQYERNDVDFSRGKFRTRGDYVDIFPAEHSKAAIRITFFDDEIDEIYSFDALTGNKINNLKRFVFYPASHFVTPRETILRAIKNIKQELKLRLSEFSKQNKLVEEQRLLQKTNFDLELLEQVGFCKGIENYSRHLSGRNQGEPPPTLIDYLPKNSLLFIDESHITLGQIGAMYKGDSSRKQNLVDYGFRLPSALDNRPLKFDEFQQKINDLQTQSIFISATPSNFELTNSQQIVEQVVRPTGLLEPEIIIKPAISQIDDLLQEIKAVIKNSQNSERILVTTLTKRMAEYLTEFLQEQQVKVRYLHSDVDTVERVEIIKNLRLGLFDVVVGINLLREGLDIPEVSLVAILDADKEGFLRSEKSLIQTIGRAARNANGRVILYADSQTESIKKAVAETQRRRQKQQQYNQKHNITPKTIRKNIKDLIDIYADKTTNFHEKSGKISENKNKNKNENKNENENFSKNYAFKNQNEMEKYLKKLTKQMKQFAENFQYEKAAQIRDEIQQIKDFWIYS